MFKKRNKEAKPELIIELKKIMDKLTQQTEIEISKTEAIKVNLNCDGNILISLPNNYVSLNVEQSRRLINEIERRIEGSTLGG